MQPASNLPIGDGAKAAGNVLTSFSGGLPQKILPDQEDSTGSAGSDGVADIVAFKDCSLSDPLKRKRRRKTKVKKGKRGPRGSKGLAWTDSVKAIFELDRLARRADL